MIQVVRYDKVEARFVSWEFELLFVMLQASNEIHFRLRFYRRNVSKEHRINLLHLGFDPSLYHRIQKTSHYQGSSLRHTLLPPPLSAIQQGEEQLGSVNLLHVDLQLAPTQPHNLLWAGRIYDSIHRLLPRMHDTWSYATICHGTNGRGLENIWLAWKQNVINVLETQVFCHSFVR